MGSTGYVPLADESPLVGQVAVVTGAVGGIGAAVCDALARDGATVIATDIHPDIEARGRSLFDHVQDESIRGSIHMANLDVTDEHAVSEFAQSVERDHGRIDILINNAGVGGTIVNVWDTPVQRWRNDLDVMLTGPFLMCRALVPLMLRGDYGRILNVSSIAGKEGNPGSAGYSSAKAGLIGLTKVLGKELAETGILVNAVAPGVVESPMNSTVSREFHSYVMSKIPMSRAGTRTELAELIRFLVSPRLGFSTGAVFDFSGGRATY